MVQVSERLNGRLSPFQEFRAELQFQVLCSRTAEVEIKFDAIGNLGHEQFSEADSPSRRLVFEDGAIGIATGVRGIVVSAIVVDGPVGELKMTVGAHVVVVEEVRRTEFADAKFQPALGQTWS